MPDYQGFRCLMFPYKVSGMQSLVLESQDPYTIHRKIYRRQKCPQRSKAAERGSAYSHAAGTC